MIVNINDIMDNYDSLLIDCPQKWIARLFVIKYNIKNHTEQINNETLNMNQIITDDNENIKIIPLVI